MDVGRFNLWELHGVRLTYGWHPLHFLQSASGIAGLEAIVSGSQPLLVHGHSSLIYNVQLGFHDHSEKTVSESIDEIYIYQYHSAKSIH